IRPIPDAAEAALAPEDIKTNDQLYLTGLHLEQYRHATFSPLDYYEEALRRDPNDYRCNNALGLWYLRKGRFSLAQKYLSRAVKVITRRNPNPYDGEPLFNLGVALKFQGKFDEAYSRFYKSTWNAAWQDAGYLECARISSMQGRTEDALYECTRSLNRNWHNHDARALKALLLFEIGKQEEALSLCEESLDKDTFNYGCLFVKCLICDNKENWNLLTVLLRDDAHNYSELAIRLLESGHYEYAVKVLDIAEERKAVTLMTLYYKGAALYLGSHLKEAKEIWHKASEMSPAACFPNSLHAISALQLAVEHNIEDANANYLLGNIYYDKRQYDIAQQYWEKALELNPGYPTVWRNLALCFFNKRHDKEKALAYMEKAFSLDPSDDRVLMELDQLYRTMGRPHADRLRLLEDNLALTEKRDDLTLERITLLNQLGRHSEAKELLDGHIFHPWEGGEGKVSGQYQSSRLELAKIAMTEKRHQDAIALLEECLVYPENLGEGKLYGAQENDFYYLMGLCYRELGDTEKAKECFLQATEGPTEPAAAMYYNDAKPDKIFYAGLAYRALGEENKARSYFNRLISYGQQHYHDEVKMDYFAVSLPDLMIWDGDLNESNRKHCLYMLALGEYGLGNFKKSEKYLKQLVDMDINHQGANAFITLKNTLKE
ncbi:MAG: tetratricopeptide repeat protein, partial [Muribaculaceae bacterium]|nr:tetratricopeptide repeat protein [Muribaculaceae bacterium]